MIELIIYFLALLNPFALFIYLLPLKRAVDFRVYSHILARASVIAFIIYAFFAVFGDAFFTSVLKISFDSFRIFGGIVLIAFALSFIIQGKESMITTKGELSKIATEVALPFMVGAGTITLSIILGNRLGAVNAVFALLIIMLVNFLVVFLLAYFRQALNSKAKDVMDHNLDVFLRINGFIAGAFGVDLVVTGIQNLFL